MCLWHTNEDENRSERVNFSSRYTCYVDLRFVDLRFLEEAQR